eukprot:XP_765323.1 hypothetical protein [Theileria parva strain Muguga]
MTNRTNYAEEDPFYDKSLTSYGESLKSMLILQKEQEVDEELKEYSDDEDSSSQVSVSSKVRAEPAKSTQPKELTFEDKVLLFLKDNNNKVTVKNVIQTKCSMTSEQKDGKMVKFISLKPK